MISRRSALSLAALPGLPAPPPAAEDEYPEHAARYLKRLYAPAGQRLAFREDYPGGFRNWQREARAGLRLKLGLEKIAASVGNHQPAVELGEAADMGEYTRQRGTIETEPGVRIPFWLLKPKGKGPRPLGIFSHGHDARGHDTTAGVYSGKAHEERSLAEDRDVAVQAARLGFIAVAPASRGLAAWVIPDLRDRHGKQSCRSHVMHCLLAGRTAMGERVWDMQRILDWAVTLPEADRRRVLMMGNSGGGMVTIFAAACDQRITVAVPSCSFAPTVSASGYVFHCDCNMVPGLMELGGLPNVAGLIAPRWLLSVSGRRDALFSNEAIESAAGQVRGIYRAAGHAGRYEHRWGGAGHRFYKDLMWPFIGPALRLDR
ncbi:MAG: dienelactone hydrolase family protein [Bryobacteraceae bacterium]